VIVLPRNYSRADVRLLILKRGSQRRCVVLKSIHLATMSVLTLLLLSSLTWAQDTPEIGVTYSTKNPSQIAILHWYDANLTTTFTVGDGPEWMAFDGANLWVANFNGNNVTKLQVSTGKVLGKYAVGAGPQGCGV
jgi:hypothetical protein